METKKYENRSCPHGEVNSITKEYWCNPHREFCKEITDCRLKLFQKHLKI